MWLGLAVVVALVHRQVPDARWLLVHLVVLGALTHAIVVWSSHFTQALLKTPPDLDPRGPQNARLGLLALGAAAALTGVPTGLWPLVVAGAVALSAAVAWHAWALARRLRAALPGRFRITVRYYLAAAACLPVGATFGAWLAHGVTEETRGRLLLAHTMTMGLGWVGLTVTGTLVTFWPTLLRTRIDPRAERWARQGLIPLVASLAVLDAGALAGLRWLAFGGLLGYLAAWLWVGRALLAPARKAPPRHYSTWSASAGLAWFVATLLLLAGHLAGTPDWAQLPASYGLLTPALVAGFAVQLLCGALAHLVPAVLGGGARAVRAAQARYDAGGAARVVAANGGLIICLLPVPSWVRVTCSVVVLGALAWFLPATWLAVRASLRAREDAGGADAAARERLALPRERGVFSAGQLVAAVSALLLAVALGVAVDPGAAGLSAGGLGAGAPAAGSAAGAAAGSGHTTRVRVEAKDMRFVPDSVDVPRGDRLEVEIVNTDATMTHDLVFPGGAHSRRLDPGAADVVDAGIIADDVQAWCGIVGHRQMGMVLQVRAIGGVSPAEVQARAGHGHAAQTPGGSSGAGASGASGGGHDVRLGQPAPADFRAVPAELPPLSAERTHRLTFTIEEVELEVAPGVRQRRWTFNGAVPGPTLHGRIGDVFEITLVNRGTMGHSIDFHAGDVAPDAPMRTIAPGQSLDYRFTARRAGIWMYHCSTMPMATHIAAGMHGAVVIEPDDLPPVEHSYVLVQSEAYVDGDGTTARDVDATAVHAERPTAVVFNGIANQYDARPLPARVGQRVRFWVLDAGPNRASSFHVVGGQFDTVWCEGAYQLRAGGPDGHAGSQALGLQAAQGGFVEMVAREPGRYPFVSHIMVDAERGAHGILQVSP